MMANSGNLQQGTFSNLERAAALNHQELFRKESLTLGGTLHSIGSLKWTSGGPTTPSMITFPSLTTQEADISLDLLMDFYRNNRPAGAGCWSLEPAQPADLGVRLLARGFQPGWRPRWMALDLDTIRTELSLPSELTVTIDTRGDFRNVSGLPYSQAVMPLLSLLESEGQWARFIARWNGKVVGQSVVFLTTGPYGAAGIYQVGVKPKFQRRGIGGAVTVAACRYAREKGFRYAVLNATDAGHRMYERMGFSVIGEGWTWWLKMDKFLERPPSAVEVRLGEAIGRGDVAALECGNFTLDVLDRTMTNGMTWMELAVHCRQPAAAEWLMSAGVACSVLDAWDLGWQELAGKLLDADPGRANHLFGEWNKSLLHIAAERGDAAFARLVLKAKPDLRVRDSAYRSTPLDWARHFGRPDMIGLLEEAGR